jgi:hypothetical protein
MLTKVSPDHLVVRTDLAEFWSAWAEGASLDTLTAADLREAKDALLAAYVPPAMAHAYFQRLAGMIANTVGDDWEHFRDIEVISDELFEAIKF